MSSDPTPDPLVPPRVFLLGEVSTGKTKALETLVRAGLEVFIISLEPGIADILGHISPDRLHWHIIQAYGAETPGQMLKNLEDTARLLQSSDMETIKKMPGRNRDRYGQFLELLGVINKFTDDRTGKDYGNLQQLSPNQVVVIDSLSGLNNMSERLVAGDKPFMSWPEFQAAQFAIEQLIATLTHGLKCWFVVTAHVERENDPITGLQKQMPSTIGKVLAPRLTKFFSEAILCKRVLNNGVSQYLWDNITTDALVKNRNIPQAGNHTPDFAIIKRNWENKQQFNQ